MNPAAGSVELVGATQLRSTSCGSPVPLRLTTADPLVDELLEMVSLPVIAPVAVGSNCRLSVAVWPELKVSGKVAPETEKPVPVIVAALTVTGVVPVEVRVTDWVAGELMTTLPKVTLVALMVSAALLGPSCKAKPAETPPALAVRDAD